MARDDRSDKGRVKVRVIEFEMEGSNQTLRESIRDIVGAIGPRAHHVQVTRAPAKALGAGAATESPDLDGTVIDVEPESLMEEPDDRRSSSAPRRRPATPRSPEVLDIDLKQGDMPLVEFLQKVNPQKEVDKYACIAYWLKHNAGISEVSMDHMHTAYRTMKWNTPVDAAWPLRAMKKREYGYMRKGSKAGLFELIHTGDNHVHDLMKAAGLEG